jgi:hypothetical protein
MKKLIIYLCSLAFGFSVAGVAGATPVGFDLAGASGGSSQTHSGTIGSANLASALDGNLGSQIFYLADGQTQTIDMSGGTLNWDAKTLSDVFTVAGNSLTADFQDGSAFVGGNTWWRLPHRPHWPPHYPDPRPPSPPGPGTAPVPEPGTILLLGSGFIGLALYVRRRMRR